MGKPTQDTSILMQRLIAWRAKHDELALKIDELNMELFDLDMKIKDGVDILLQANEEDPDPQPEVVRVVKR